MYTLVLRTFILYIVVIGVMRLMGKRQIGELQPFEFAVTILISEVAALPMQNKGIPLLNGIIPILTLLVAQLLVSLVSTKSTFLRELLCGKPSILIENGRIHEKNLRKEMYTIDDLLEQLRIKDVPNISDVEFAILETNGQISIIPKSQKKSLNPSDLNIPTRYEGLSIELIVDGTVVKKNLQKASLDLDWLQEKLESLNIKDPKDVLFASLDSNGKMFYQLKKGVSGND